MKKQVYGQFAIDCYLEHFNNYRTITQLAEKYNMSAHTMYDLINRGRKLVNQ